MCRPARKKHKEGRLRMAENSVEAWRPRGRPNLESLGLTSTPKIVTQLQNCTWHIYIMQYTFASNLSHIQTTLKPVQNNVQLHIAAG